MFCGHRKRQQNESQDVDVKDESSSNTQKSGIVEKDSKQVLVVPETPTTSAATDSTPSEAPKRKTKRSSWWHSVDTFKEFEGGDAGVQENSPSPDLMVSSSTQTKKLKKKYWWCRPFRHRHIKEQSESSADMHKESEISHPSVTTNSFSKSDKTSNDETTKTNSNVQSMEINSNIESMEIDSNVKSTEIDSNFDSKEIDSNADSTEIDSNVKSMEIDSNVESMEIDSNVESMEIDSNVESMEIDTNVESMEIDTNVEAMEIDSNVESMEIDSNVESMEIDSNFKSTEIDTNVESMEINKNIKSTENDSNDESTEIDPNMESTEIDSNIESIEIDSNVESMEIDLNIKSTEIDTNVESMEINMNIKSTENDSNVDSTEIDTIVKSMENDSNDESTEIDPNTESTEIDNVESTEIYFNVALTNVQSTQAYSNIETSNPDFSFMTDYAKRYLKSQNVVYIKDVLPPDVLKYRPYAQICHKGSKQAKSESVYGNLAASRETLSTEKLVCLGLPNLAQTCFMNSTLQGLLTLTHFMQEVHRQHTVWNFHPQSELIRLFENIELCHSSTDQMKKKCVLFAFKKSIAELNSQFDNDSQKDAYEFLSCVLTKTRSLYVDLHQSAVDMGMTYTCSINAHMAFQMLSTCVGYELKDTNCDITNSLETPDVDLMLKNQLEYCCKSCHTQEASQQWSFVSLPNVLIIQLQRFRSTKSNNLSKLDIVLYSDSNTTEQTRYSLVSIIDRHLGSSAASGHYICDSAYRQQEPGDMTNCWLTYIDSITKESTAKCICQLQQKTAYLLFYEKQQ